jgi:xylulose-5-phosphate/fructose-6-phosphate phosphoketolase
MDLPAPAQPGTAQPTTAQPTTAQPTTAQPTTAQPGPAPLTTRAPEGYVLDDVPGPLTGDLLHRMDAWWRAANYLSVGQIYLMANPLLREPLGAEHVKPRLLGHWGTTPGLNLLYTHANRVIRDRDLDAVCVMGPGHGGPAANACAWLEGTYGELYPGVRRDERGMAELFRQFSFPGGVPSHCAPQTPGSFHEGGELGYSLMHAYGAAVDNPGLTVFCVIGDGEAETGPLAASWHLNKLINPARDGAVLPVLALNGYKIANPSVLARIPQEELIELLRGYGYEPHVVRATTDTNPARTHQALAAALDTCLDAVAEIQQGARAGGRPGRPRWPMIVLATPKGWTGPPVVDGVAVEGTFRSHQVPLADVRNDSVHRDVLEQWLRSYRPQELFDARGGPAPGLISLPPDGERRMSANPVTVAGPLRDLDLPDFRAHGVEVPAPAVTSHEATRVLGGWLREVARRNPHTFLLTAPDEVASNRLQDVLDVGGRSWVAETVDGDDRLSPDGRSMEILSEHLCQGLLEGYLLTGRHGVFTCYEAFIHIVDSMFNQHAKWLEASAEVPWRQPVASLNYLLSSHVWRQDHNGSTHQDPGFLDVVLNKKPHVVRVYLPPDANTLLCTYDHCLRSRNYVNVVVAGKQPQLDYLPMDEAIAHCARGIGIWDWAGSQSGEAGPSEPDVILACAGEVPTLETVAAADILRRRLPELAVRVVNVVDLMRLQPASEHPHGLPDPEFDALFSRDRPVIFAFHGYPWLIHRLTYRRANHRNLHVRGFKENGTTTTPFDMVMLNDIDRYHLVMDVIDRVPGLTTRAAGVRQDMVDARLRAKRWTREYGEDHPEVAGWSRPATGR